MRKALPALWLTCVWLTALTVSAQSVKSDLNNPVPPAVRKSVADALEMTKRDRFSPAVAALKKAIASAPNYVNAHIEYVQLKANFMNRYDEVRREYEDLMNSNPGNPVYPMALAAANYQTANSSKNA